MPLNRSTEGTRRHLTSAQSASEEALIGFRGGGYRPARPGRRRGCRGAPCPDGGRCGRVGRSRDRRAASPARCHGCGRNQERSSDQKPSAVLTWTSQEPSPSSSRGILAPGVAHRLVAIAPFFQAGVDVVLVGVDEGAPGDAGLDDRPDGRLPDVGQHPDHHLAAALEQTQDRRLLLLERAAPGRGPQPASSPTAPLLATAAGLPSCPATT